MPPLPPPSAPPSSSAGDLEEEEDDDDDDDHEFCSDSDSSGDASENAPPSFGKRPGGARTADKVRFGAQVYACFFAKKVVRGIYVAFFRLYGCNLTIHQRVGTWRAFLGHGSGVLLMLLVWWYPRKKVYIPALLLLTVVDRFFVWKFMSDLAAGDPLECGPLRFVSKVVPGLRPFDVFNYTVFQLLLCRFTAPSELLLKVIMLFDITIASTWFFLHLGFTAFAFIMIAVLLLGAALAVYDMRAVDEEMEKQADLEWDRRAVSANLFHMLRCMLPPSLVKPMLQDPDRVRARHVIQATVLFILIEDFDRLARELSPEDSLRFLNEVFLRLDRICADHDVTKIETVGAEYVCAVGVEPDDFEEGTRYGHDAILKRLIQVSLDVLELQYQAELQSELLGDPVKFKMGMHTGPLVAGVVGRKLPRFRLFGDTINTAARMMQKGLPGEVQFGEATRQCLPDSTRIRCRGDVEMKGKGSMTTYLLLHRFSCRSMSPMSSVGSAVERQPTAHSRGLLAMWLSRKRRWAHVSGAPEAPAQPKATTSPQGVRRRRLSNVEDFDATVSEISSGTLAALPPPWQCSCSWLLGWPELTEAEEEDFQWWFYKECVYLPLATHISTWTIALVLITVVEFAWLLYRLRRFDRPGDWLVALWQLRVFCCLRISALLMMALGWVTWSRLLRNTVLRWHRVASVLHVLGAAALSEFILMSYSSMRWSASLDSCVIAPGSSAGCHFADNWNLLLAVPMSIFVLLACPGRFSHSAVFILANILFCYSLYQVFDNNDLFYDSETRYVLRQVIFLVMVRAYLMEGIMRRRFKEQSTIKLMTQRIDGVLNTLMPPLVAQSLLSNPGCLASELQHRYSSATVAQSDLCGFTELASTRRPGEVVEFITDLFGLFDMLTDEFQVYKIETVGDAYIAGQAGPPLTRQNSPVSVVLFALGMIEATHRWSALHGEAISCRVGVQTGRCVGGVVGSDMQRYHLFGGLMTALEVLESTAPRGSVQASAACAAAVSEEVARLGLGGAVEEEEENAERGCDSSSVLWPLGPSHPAANGAGGEGTGTVPALPAAARGLRLEPRVGDVLLTSKGELHSYDEVGGRTYLAVAMGILGEDVVV